MLQRILDVPEEDSPFARPSSLRVVAVSGSSLPGSLATTFMDAFGDVLYNLYGSTEVGVRHDGHADRLCGPSPNTAGRPLRGTTVAILDEDARPCRRGSAGTSSSATSCSSSGYTGGGTKATACGSHEHRRRRALRR